MLTEYFFATIALVYFLTHLLLYKGFRNSLNLPVKQSNNLPKVSVIVAGRNEEANIGRCITSLSKLNYPKELLEIILVNDNSTDRTFEIMNEETRAFDFFKVINSRTNLTKNLKGKANAIDTAIEQCECDIILSTDADCEVAPEWIMETVKYYKDTTGMICGFTSMNTEKTLFDKMQTIDWTYLLTLASASAGLKMILSCVGNNLSFRRKTYDEVGGYSSINFSVTEDLALMRKVDAGKKFDILFPVNKHCVVKTFPCKNLQELFSQKRRWFKGGIGINILGYLVGFELYMMSFFLLFGLLFVNYKFYLIIIVIKILSELLLISKTFERLGLQTLYKYYLHFNIYFALYGLILPLSFLFKTKIKWKGQKF